MSKMQTDKHAEALKKLVIKLEKHNLQNKFYAHKQFAFLLFRKADDAKTAEMSVIQKRFNRYVETEKSSQNKESAKYRWRIKEFREGHPELFGDDRQTRLSKLEQMITALQDELAAARDDVQRNSYRIKEIKSVRLGVNNEVYACYLNLNDDEEPSFKEGLPYEIRMNRITVGRGDVVEYESEEQCIYLTADQDISKLIGASVRLFVDMTWLLVALIEKLKSRPIESLMNGPLKGFLRGTINQQEVRYPLGKWQGDLNKSQSRAFVSALEKNITLIWGPPGTGKSYTLAHIILGLARVTGKTIVACISNAALDALISNLLEVLDKYEKNRGSYTFNDSCFVRLGVSRTPKVLKSKMIYPEDPQVNDWKVRLSDIQQLLAEEASTIEKVKLKKEYNATLSLIKDHNRQRISRAKVIFATAAQFTVSTVDRNKKKDEETLGKDTEPSLVGVRFDNIILDEVSMMYPPQFVALCQDAAKRIIAAGDFRQLGPIHLSATSLALRWLDQDVFTFAKMFNRQKEIRRVDYVVQLLEQFRSHENVCNLINGPFYEGKLSSLAKLPVNDPLDLPPYERKPVVYVNLEKNNRNVVQRSSKGSRWNDYSANISAFLAKWVTNESDTVTVGVIAPYRMQVAKINGLLQAGISSQQLKRIKVGSIHSFQGDEADVIIYDIVDAPNEKLGVLYRDNTGERLINVAVSRAKRKLIVIGDIQNMHDGRGHMNIAPKVKQITKMVSRCNYPMVPQLRKFLQEI